MRNDQACANQSRVPTLDGRLYIVDKFWLMTGKRSFAILVTTITYYELFVLSTITKIKPFLCLIFPSVRKVWRNSKKIKYTCSKYTQRRLVLWLYINATTYICRQNLFTKYLQYKIQNNMQRNVLVKLELFCYFFSLDLD